MRTPLKSSQGEPPDWTVRRAVLVALMDQYLSGLMDPHISLLEVNKLMYFVQEAGEELDLRFKWNWNLHGPSSYNVCHEINQIQGHFVVRHDLDSTNSPLELVEGVREDAKEMLDEHPKTQKRFERVASLIEGFETPIGMELLATVHWVVEQKGFEFESNSAFALTAIPAIQRRHRGDEFTEYQILTAWKHLEDGGWF